MFPNTTVTKCHKLDVLKTTKLYSLTVLETKSLKSKCWQGHLPPKPSLGIYHSLPLTTSYSPGHSLICGGITSTCASIVTGPSFPGLSALSETLHLISPSNKIINHIGLQPNQVLWWRSYFQIRSWSQLSRVRTSICIWQRHNSTQ